MASFGGDNNDRRPGPIATSAVVAVCSLLCLVICAVVGLTLAGRPIDNVVYLITGLLAPTIGTLLASKRLDDQSKQLNLVTKQVNGKMDNLISDKAELESQVHRLGGIPDTLPSARHSAENIKRQETNNG